MLAVPKIIRGCRSWISAGSDPRNAPPTRSPSCSGQIRDSLTRIAKDTSYTLADLNQFREYVMAQFDEVNDKLDGRDGEQPEPQSPDQPAEPSPAEPTNPADNPNDQPER